MAMNGRTLGAAIIVAIGLAGCGDDTVSTRTVTVQRSTPDVVAQGGTPATTTPLPGEIARTPTGYTRCDANIAAKRGTTTCGFATNAFYEYWKSAKASDIKAFSPASNRIFATQCTAAAGEVECTTSDGGVVRFSQAAVDRYSKAQADAYAADHELAPTPVTEGGGTPAPADTSTTSAPATG
jgi:hypothetical protein